MFQGRPNEVGLECQHTIKSHGWALFKNHKHDWLILILLAVIEIILYLMHPFYRFVGEDMMADLKYPMKDDTVPVWAVPLYSVLLPFAIFILYYIRRRDVYDLHNAILGILFAVLITGVLTDAIKNAVGRPRPDFFWRCFPDGNSKYDQWGDVVCHGKDSDLKEGHKSFPSGHTSWSFAGLGFLSLYLSGKIKCFDQRGHVAKLCIFFLPILAACLVGISRVDDYKHHWQDVFAGGLLGLVAATFCYLQFFPPPYHTQGWSPYAYFRAVEESRANVRSTEQPGHGISLQNVTVEGMNRQQSRIRGNSVYYNLDSTAHSMESGNR
ncbi:lipid phosphate phosphatase 2-like [Primulina huaijiensis]|uniref:lipid phosphate phosphatase 2-like n=1 Tax=Primulina huaijiensis TaxID=1492673 RepID=UPI003CC753E4